MSTDETTQQSMAQGIASLLTPVVTDMDKAIVSAQKSQEGLGKEIERLITELEHFKDIAEPPQLHPALEKLTDSRKKLASANKLMQQTQLRVQRMEAQLQSSST
ncbi:hypothetical protein O0I10_007017 [Lichtheimia ornata]|uniref:Biogenesis of lysosome-related organelles complex 1 subunit 7 n=1 Tax=Lichtheimia ornata TaxID=688661 RepID=A0AAD7XY63_9FUNG|nr:uncharacterized protein O0I10_007017 [Lichtheimia ornata]KAJ8657201.1 hypothetical protein O0I10_007017 [Lichtheimia ornata]